MGGGEVKMVCGSPYILIWLMINVWSQVGHTLSLTTRVLVDVRPQLVGVVIYDIIVDETLKKRNIALPASQPASHKCSFRQHAYFLLERYDYGVSAGFEMGGRNSRACTSAAPLILAAAY